MNSEMKKELEKRVKHVVSLSKEIPWYVRKYKEFGIDPDEIRKPEDLLKAYEEGLYTTPADLPELVYYKHPEAKGPFYTSGTTGKPKEIWTNPDDEKYFIKKFERVMKNIFTKNDRILNCLPKEPAISGYIMNQSLSASGYLFIHAPAQEVGTDIEKFLNYLKKIDPTSLVSLTTFAYRLPVKLEKVGIDSRTFKINKLITGAEPSTIERRKTLGMEFNALVYDWYVTSETYGMVANEIEPFTDQYLVNIPDVLLFLVKDNTEVDIGEIGNVLLTNLYGNNLSQPYMVLLNYEIGDWAKCMEKEDNGIVSSISEIRREAVSLAGAKLNPQEVEKCIEELEKYKNELSGEYFIISYSDNERRAIGEIRVESKKILSLKDKKIISEKLREKIYSINFPVWNEVENVKNAKLLIEVTNPGELYKGYEEYIKPGKPKRLLVLKDV